MRVIIEAREKGNNFTVALDVQSDNWLDEKKNAADKRQGIINAANGVLRSMNLTEIEESE